MTPALRGALVSSSPFKPALSHLLRTRGWLTTRDLTVTEGISRQAAQSRLARMVEAGQLRVEGRGKATRYLPGLLEPPRFDRTTPTAGLDEADIWRELLASLPELSQFGRDRARRIGHYAVVEMVNNSIDHAFSAAVRVSAWIRSPPSGSTPAASFVFEVKDDGIGAFESVRAHQGLADALSGLQEISKGKTTTAPDRHAGEGIFFTSKLADRFELTANGLRWIVDNQLADHAVLAAAPAPGTLVRFEIALDTVRAPEQVFSRFTNEDLVFDTSATVVKLFTYGVDFAARSEGRRLLHGLERFQKVILDFSGVQGVGQGFCDEVFRVWPSQHPEVRLQPIHMNEPVGFMVGRALKAAATQAPPRQG